MQARARAQRTGFPQGVRFVHDGSGFVREAQLIEVPEPYNMPAGNFLMIEQFGTGTAAPSGPYVSRILVVGPNAADVRNNVAVGDTLSIPSLGSIHRVDGFQPAAGAWSVNINGTMQNVIEIRVSGQLLGPGQSKIPDLGAASKALPIPPGEGTPNQPVPPFSYSTPTFGFIRQARPVFGEPPLQVSDTLSILVNSNDLAGATNQSLSLLQPPLGGTAPYPYFDIVFSPNGEVQNAGGLGRMVLWVGNTDAVRAVALPTAGGPRSGGDVRTIYEQAGEMTLITVYTKTGAVATHPVKLPSPTFTATEGPYDYTKDGIASGL
jgi:hypothetical protein